MPLYEYQCEACGHRFEVIQKFSDAPVEMCPRCSGVVRKLLSSPAIQFKGSGWYITDYARAGKSDGAGETKTTDAKPASGTPSSEKAAETKTEGKVESKPESKPATS
jgi:putative FmdB family regulatory protein